MCGINGIFNPSGQPVQRIEVERMRDAATHRGPDGTGCFISRNGQLGLGHRRLSIIDLNERSAQPYTEETNRYTITYNGEIFNYKELREDLISLGHAFRTTSDTEVVLTAYKQWGQLCLNRFNGMWAFAIWDEVEQKLFLSRDRFGIKPLYFTARVSDTFAFASEINQFKQLSSSNFRINYDHLINCIADPFSLEGNGLSILNDVEALLPGHFLEISASSFTIQRWWSTMDDLPNVPSDYIKQVEQFKELLFDSVRLRLNSDVNIASALSGGLDSSSIFSILHNNTFLDTLDSNIQFKQSFVASFPGTAQDETSYAQSVIQHLNASAIIFTQEFNHLADTVIATTKHFGQVYSTPIIPISDIYKQMKFHGFTVSLDGHGVDEMMYGYAGLQRQAAIDAMKRNDISTAQDLISTHNSMWPGSSPRRITNSSMQKQTRYSTLLTIQRKIKAKIKFDLRKEYYIHPKTPKLHQRQFPESNRIQLDSEKALYHEFHRGMLPTILRNFDIASMMHGVESRAPFMDYRIVQFVFALPQSSKTGSGFTKRILRDSMKGILNETVRTRKLKTGLNAPIDNWLKSSLKTALLDDTSSSQFQQCPVWNGKKIHDDLNRYFNPNSVEREPDWGMIWKIWNAHIITSQ